MPKNNVIFARDTRADGTYYTRMGTPVRVVEVLPSGRVQVAYECPGYGVEVAEVRPHELFFKNRPAS